jgi:hypothetical protein
MIEIFFFFFKKKKKTSISNHLHFLHAPFPKCVGKQRRNKFYEKNRNYETKVKRYKAYRKNNYKTYKPYIKQHRRPGARIVPLVRARNKRKLFHDPVSFIVDQPSVSEDEKIAIRQEMQKRKKIVLVVVTVRRLPQEPHVVTLRRPVFWEELVCVSLVTSKDYHAPVEEYLVGSVPPAVLEAFGELFHSHAMSSQGVNVRTMRSPTVNPLV